MVYRRMWTAFGIGTVMGAAVYNVTSTHVHGLNWRLILRSVSVFQFLLAFLNLTYTTFEAGVPALIVMSLVYLCPESPR